MNGFNHEHPKGSEIMCSGKSEHFPKGESRSYWLFPVTNFIFKVCETST